MANLKASDEAKRRAFNHVVNAVDSSAHFPRKVFRGNWETFLFFESDRMFASGFASIMGGLLNAQHAEVCCLVNFSETNRLAYESAATLFIDSATEPQEYAAMLRQGGPTKGWLFDMDRYGSASDRGGWSIYCEKGNDLAVIAICQPNDAEKYAEYLKQLHAEPIAKLLKTDFSAPVPFGQLAEPWRDSLAQHYGD